jgi:branched-chain amino acid transport system permease protein
MADPGLIHSEGRWSVETRTRTSSVFLLISVPLMILALSGPAFLSRSALQDIFFILSMLFLAQCWNLLAGYAGLVSVGQQAFVGLGAYVMFAAVILFGLDPIVGALLAGVLAAALSVLTGYFVFRLQGAYFAIGTWVIA